MVKFSKRVENLGEIFPFPTAFSNDLYCRQLETRAFLGKGYSTKFNYLYCINAPPGWLSGERVGLMTWWLRVRSPVEAYFLSKVFSPFTSAEACEKSSWWLWKEE